MIRKKRGDTKIGSMEKKYGIDLGVRSDTKLSSFLSKKGFSSWSEYLRARRGQLGQVTSKRRAFLSFHYEDYQQVAGFRLMAANSNVSLEFHDESVRVAIDSENGAYVKKKIKEKLSRAEVAICLIGNSTGWRDWVEWELRTAHEMGLGVCGIRLKGSRGRAPDVLRELSGPVSGWSTPEDFAVLIEQAIALR